jgi:hypothetical protein
LAEQAFLTSGRPRPAAHPITLPEVPSMSIVRVGLAETKNFAEGYDRIFGKKEEKKDEEQKKDEGCCQGQQTCQTEQPEKK